MDMLIGFICCFGVVCCMRFPILNNFVSMLDCLDRLKAGFAVTVCITFNSVSAVVWFMKALTLNPFSSMLGSSVRVKTGVCSVLGYFSLLSCFRGIRVGLNCVCWFKTYGERSNYGRKML